MNELINNELKVCGKLQNSLKSEHGPIIEPRTSRILTALTRTAIARVAHKGLKVVSRHDSLVAQKACIRRVLEARVCISLPYVTQLTQFQLTACAKALYI
jgi:hypothetical protein